MGMMRSGDIDLDTGDREKLLALIQHIPASMRKVDPIRKHASGVYITEIPYDPILDMASIDYAEAEERGYFKLDILNVHVYDQIRNETHLVELMREPNWDKLTDRKFVEQLIHLNNQFYLIKKMPESINSIPRLAMFLAVIRPSKRHLFGKTWKEISKTVWDKDENGYQFRKSHAIAYAHLVCIHMNLLEEQANDDS